MYNVHDIVWCPSLSCVISYNQTAGTCHVYVYYTKVSPIFANTSAKGYVDVHIMCKSA